MRTTILKVLGPIALVDFGHRANCMSEMLTGLRSKFQFLDPLQDCLGTAPSNSSNRIVGSLLALACAQELVLMTESPVLCINNLHVAERAAIPAMPLISQTSTKATST